MKAEKTCRVDGCRRVGAFVKADDSMKFTVCREHATMAAKAQEAQMPPKKALDWWGAWAGSADLHELVENLLDKDSGIPDPWLGRIILHLAKAEREAADYFIQAAEVDQAQSEAHHAIPKQLEVPE